MSIVQAVAVWALSLGAPGYVSEWAEEAGLRPEVRQALAAGKEAPPHDFVTHAGWVLVALQNVYFRLLHARSPEDGIIATVMAGGDTDANVCLAGALLEAICGAQAVHERWREKLPLVS